MTRALIMVNGVDGSNDDLPIGVLVNLSNHGNGGELTYLWSILDQPDGAADVLSATNVQSPTITINKEGTYLLQLVVNQNLADEATATAILGVRYLRTHQRSPAAGEALEDSLSLGHSRALIGQQQELNQVGSDANLVVAQVPGTGYAAGQVVALTGVAVIKSGLPGQETVLTCQHALANASLGGHVLVTTFRVGVIERSVKGTAPVANDLVLVRIRGLAPFTPTGVPTNVGDPVYVDDTGAVSLTAGTNTKQIGYVLAFSAGTYNYFVNA